MVAKSKSSTQRRASFGKGGDDKMFPRQAADRLRPGHTGKAQGAFARGGARTVKNVGRGATHSQVGPTGTDPAEAQVGDYARGGPVRGGLSLPAKPGRCGT